MTWEEVFKKTMKSEAPFEEGELVSIAEVMEKFRLTIEKVEKGGDNWGRNVTGVRIQLGEKKES